MSDPAKQPLRCIGGANHGNVVEVERDQKQVTMEKRLPISLTPDFRHGFASAGHRVTTTVYSRRLVRTDTGDLEFLAPQDWSDFAALSHVIAP